MTTEILFIAALICAYALALWVVALAAWLIMRPQMWARFGGVGIFVAATVVVLEVLP